MHIRVLYEQRPIEPIRFVVLTVSVVVAVLRAPDFIAHQEHGKPKREQRDGHEILHLAVSESLNFRIVVGPSTPQFQLRLSSAPSRLSSPLASLCLWS